MSPRNGDPEEEGGSRGGRNRSQQRASGSRGGNSEDYRRRRDRNNLAVKRSRVRSKLRTQETLERVRTLKAENEALEDRIQALGRELGFLKELFIAHAGATGKVNLDNVDLEAVLRDDPDDDLLRLVGGKEAGSRSNDSHRTSFKAESPGDGDAEDSEPPGPS